MLLAPIADAEAHPTGGPLPPVPNLPPVVSDNDLGVEPFLAEDLVTPGLRSEARPAPVSSAVEATGFERTGDGEDEAGEDGAGCDVLSVSAAVAATGVTSRRGFWRWPLTPSMFSRRCFAQRRAFISEA